MRKLPLLITSHWRSPMFAFAGCGSDDDDDAAGDAVTVELVRGGRLRSDRHGNAHRRRRS